MTIHEVAYISSSDELWGECESVYSSGESAIPCDTNLSDLHFYASGICGWTNNTWNSSTITECLSAVAVTGSRFVDPSMGNDGDPCDTSTSDGEYVADGHVISGVCVSD
jgi:hypothetical protein